MSKIKVKTMKVYFDNGATTMLAKEAFDAMKPFFSKSYANASSLHELGREAREAIEGARAKIAKKMGANAQELIFTSGGTESNNLAIKGIAFAYKEKGKHIITTKIEHDCVLNACKWLEKSEGFKVTYLNVDKEGFVDIEQLKKEITDETILVSVIHANNEIGTIQNLKEIGNIVKEHGKNTLFHTDACQSFTKTILDVDKQQLDLCTINAHKIHGPKGVGALYIRKGVRIVPLSHGGGHEFNKRSGTENVPGIIGFGKSVELLDEKGIKQVHKLRNYMMDQIEKGISNVVFNGSREQRLCNNINYSFKFIEGESLLLHLDMAGIAVSTGSACSSKSLEPSHVLLALGLPHEIAHGSIRFTLSKYSTKEEVDYTIKHLKEAVRKLRKMSPLGPD